MHTIRLRGPWQCLVDGTTARSLKLPDDDLQAIAAQADVSCMLERKFNRPSGLENEDIYLSIRFAPIFATIMLNGHPLGETSGNDAPVRFDIRKQLKERNVLRLDVHDPAAWAASDSSICEVRLEIQEESEETH